MGQGRHLKRISLHGRGRSGRRLKYRSHLTVVLKEDDTVQRKTIVRPMLPERPSYWRGRGEGGETVARELQQRQQQRPPPRGEET